MKKVFWLALVCLAVLLCGCQSGFDSWNEDIFEQYMGSNYHSTVKQTQGSNAQKKRIVGYACQDYNTPFAVSVRDEVLKAFKGADMNVEVTVYDGESNVEKQLSQLELMISQRVDIILLDAISFASCERAIETAAANNIPVVTVISKVSNQQYCASFIGPDQYSVGTTQAEVLAKRMKGKGNIVILENTPLTASQLERSQAYQDVLANYPEINMLDVQCAHGKEKEAYVIARNWLRQEDAAIDGILAQTDSMALGAAQAARDNGKEVLIVGVDGEQEAIEAVENGELLATVVTDTGLLASQIRECVENILSGIPSESEYIIPSIVVV